MEAFWRCEDNLWRQSGYRSGVHIYDVDACKTSRIWPLSAGHSVYLLGISPDGIGPAAGTKGNTEPAEPREAPLDVIAAISFRHS